MTINFSNELKTGIEVIDHEHQLLISVLNTASIFLIDNLEVTRVKIPINIFYRMAKAHFRNEEEILERTNHPDKELHRNEHQKLEKELNGILVNSEPEDLPGIINGLEKWLLDHILEWDTKIKMPNQVYPTHAQYMRTIMNQ